MMQTKTAAAVSLLLPGLLAACERTPSPPSAQPAAAAETSAALALPARPAADDMPLAAAKPAEPPPAPADARGAVELRVGTPVDVRWSERPLLAYVWRAQDGTRIDLAIRVEPGGDIARLESTVHGKTTTVARFAYDETSSGSGMVLEAIGSDQLCLVTTHVAGRRSHWSATAVLAMYARDSQGLAVYETWSGSLREEMPAWAVSARGESTAVEGNL